MAKKNFVYDFDEACIRGSFINFVITIFYIILIFLSILYSGVAKNVREIESFLIGFFVTSFGIWTGKKSIEMWRSRPPTIRPMEPIPTEGVRVSGKSDPKQDQHTISSENQ